MGQIRKVRAGLVKEERVNFVGEKGNIFFDIDTGVLYLSDGVTPGGKAIYQSGSGGTMPPQPVNIDVTPITVSDPSSLTNSTILQFDAVSESFEPVSLVDAFYDIEGELDVKQYETLLSESKDGNVTYTYVGEAEPGSTIGSAQWRIKRIAEYADGSIDSLWANNTAAFDKVWNDRATYTYDK